MKIKTKHNSFKYTFLELRVLLPSFQFNYTESHFPQLAIKKDCISYDTIFFYADSLKLLLKLKQIPCRYIYYIIYKFVSKTSS